MDENQRVIRRKKRVLEQAEQSGSVHKTCRYIGISRASFYLWRQAYRRFGDDGLIDKRPVARRHPNQTPHEIVDKVLHLRRTYHLGPIRIVWYLARHHGIPISDAGVYRILKRHGVNRLPRKVGTRAVHTKRYDKQVPGHHIQVDVEFLSFKGKRGNKIKRYQFTDIDDVTRIRALKIYLRQNQASAIDFICFMVRRTGWSRISKAAARPN